MWYKEDKYQSVFITYIYVKNYTYLRCSTTCMCGYKMFTYLYSKDVAKEVVWQNFYFIFNLHRAKQCQFQGTVKLIWSKILKYVLPNE